MRSLLFTLVATIICSTSSAAGSYSADFLFGRWEGVGYKGVGTNKIERISTECNYGRSNNAVAVIQARYVERLSSVVHTEFGTLTPIDSKGKYRFWMKKEDNSEMEGVAQIDGINQKGILTFVLPPKSPGGPNIIVEYTITVKNNDWLEIGKMSSDGGKTWLQIYEMKLKKTAKNCTVLK